MASREVLDISDEVRKSKKTEETKGDCAGVCAGASTVANERVSMKIMENGVKNVVIRDVLAGGSSRLLLVIFSCLLLSLPASALTRNPGCILKQLHPFCPIEDDVCVVDPIHDAYCADSSIDDYLLLKPLGSGGFGATWTATRWDDRSQTYVVKKIKGIHLYGRDHVGRLIEYFISRDEMIVVSLYEGRSLSSLLYDTTKLDGVVVGAVASDWSRWLRMTSGGRAVMRILFYQMLSGLSYCHALGITHRDVKPENMVVCFLKSKGSCISEQIHIERKVKSVHLGLDDYSIKQLYGRYYPGRFGQTFNYCPPEAFERPSDWQQGPAAMRIRYDMWTVGHVMLEVVLGRVQVFNKMTTMEGVGVYSELVSRASHLDGRTLIRLVSLAEFCIFVPDITDMFIGHFPHCVDGAFEGFRQHIESLDPYHSRLRDIHLLRLIWSLLAVDPGTRLTAYDALHHPYFQEPSHSGSLRIGIGGLRIFVSWLKMDE